MSIKPNLTPNYFVNISEWINANTIKHQAYYLHPLPTGKRASKAALQAALTLIFMMRELFDWSLFKSEFPNLDCAATTNNKNHIKNTESQTLFLKSLISLNVHCFLFITYPSNFDVKPSWITTDFNHFSLGTESSPSAISPLPNPNTPYHLFCNTSPCINPPLSL